MPDKAKQSQGPKIVKRKLTVFEEYFYANLLWWAFLAVVAVVSFFACGGVWDDVAEGVFDFILFILGGGFALVSLLDYLYEKHVAKSLPDEGR
jgi:hypothetical protein